MKESLEHRRQRHKTVLVHKKPSTKVESTFHKVRTVENAVPYTLVIGSGQSLSQLALHATKTVAVLHKGAQKDMMTAAPNDGISLMMTALPNDARLAAH